MRTRAGQITLSIICLLVGVLLVTQFRTQSTIQRSVLAEPATNQAQLISNLYDGNLSLRKELVALSSQIDQYSRSSEQSQVNTMLDDLDRLRVATGTAPVAGPGVEMLISAPLTREDVQDLINELRNAGAEALSLNGQRVVAQTTLVGDQRGMTVNGVAIQIPYLFSAIGNPETIERAVVRKGGVLAIVGNSYPDGTFAVSKLDNITLRAIDQAYRLTQAKPADR